MVKTKAKKDSSIRVYFDSSKCTACKTCELACAVEHSKSKVLDAAINEKPKPKSRVKIIVKNGKIDCIRCHQCKKPRCVEACEVSALIKDEKTGIVVFDKDKCTACWKCVEACPFHAIFKDEEGKKVAKCDLCPERTDYACVASCPTGAVFSCTQEDFIKRRSKKK